MDKTALYKLSYGLYLVGVRSENGGFGGCVVDAVAQVGSGATPVVLLGSMKDNLTNALIRASGEFTLSVLPEDADPFVVANFGFQSARDEPDKWGNVKYALRDGLPALDGAVAGLRLRVTDRKELDTHTAFFANVEDAWKNEGVAPPLLYAHYQKNMKAAANAAFKTFKEGSRMSEKVQWRCNVCGHVYDGETPFEELPDDWVCPRCGVGKEVFEKV